MTSSSTTLQVSKYYTYDRFTSKTTYHDDALYMYPFEIYHKTSRFNELEYLDFVVDNEVEMYVERTFEVCTVHSEIPKHWLIRIMSAEAFDE